MEPMYRRLTSPHSDLIIKTHPYAEIVWWGSTLKHFSPDDCISLERPVANGRLDTDTPLTLMAENGAGLFGSPGLEGHRNGLDASPVFRTISVVQAGESLTLTSEDAVAGLRMVSDPKVWREGGYWWMVIGARDTSDTGQVLLYRGTSLRDWRQERVLAQSAAGESYMWECPDFFRCGDHHWLMFSPQGMTPGGYRFRNRFQSGVLPGHWQPGAAFALSGAFEELDHGHDFYAPQSLVAEDGRRIIMAWMNMWDSPMPTKREAWAGCLTLPRELFERHGRLCQRPVREAESLRGTCQPLHPVRLSGTQLLAEDAQAVELVLTWHTLDSQAEHYGIHLGDGLRLYVDNQAGRLVLWRHYPDEGLDGYRSIALPGAEYLTLRVFLDRSSVEVFVNDGDATLSSRIYPQPGTRRLSLYAAHGEAVLTDGSLWTLA